MDDLEKTQSGLFVPKAEPSARDKIVERVQWAINVTSTVPENVRAAVIVEMVRQDAALNR